MPTTRQEAQKISNLYAGGNKFLIYEEENHLSNKPKHGWMMQVSSGVKSPYSTI
jgi:hypothetical protein